MGYRTLRRNAPSAQHEHARRWTITPVIVPLLSPHTSVADYALGRPPSTRLGDARTMSGARVDPQEERECGADSSFLLGARAVDGARRLVHDDGAEAEELRDALHALGEEVRNVVVRAHERHFDLTESEEAEQQALA